MSPPRRLTRRAVAGGAIAVGTAAAAAVALRVAPGFFRQRAHGAYADLVNRLGDPSQAARVGSAWLDGDGQGRRIGARRAADDLRRGLAGRSLDQLLLDDTVRDGGLVEVSGWVLPLSLAKLCLLAAQPD